MTNLFCMRLTGNTLFYCNECKEREEMLTHLIKQDVGTYCVKYNSPVHPYIAKTRIEQESDDNE